MTDLDNECPFSGMDAWECKFTEPGTPAAATPDHVVWHTNKMVDEGMIIVIAESVDRNPRDKMMVLRETWGEWER